MKKYIIFILISVFGLVGFSFGYSACDGGSEADCCSEDPIRCCELYPNNILCGTAGGNQNQCPTERSYIKDGKQECCPEGEEYNIVRNKCVENCNGEFYGRGGLTAGANKCCPTPGIIYDKDSVTNNYASCCEGKQVYSNTEIYTTIPSLGPTEDNNLKCCKYGNVVAKNTQGNYICISCNTLKQEIQGYGSGTLTSDQQQKKSDYTNNCSDTTNCDNSKKYTDDAGASKCCDGIVQDGKCITNSEGAMGIEMDQDCLINGQCKFDIYSTLGIRQSLPRETRSSPGIFIQDVILSATFFVGTLITAVLIISGLLFVFSAAKPELAAKAKKGITGSLIGLLFVVGSYAFVRLIQFLITGGGG